MSWILGYGAMVNGRQGAKALWNDVKCGRKSAPSACREQNTIGPTNYTDLLTQNLQKAFYDFSTQWPIAADFLKNENLRLGVIYAATKGAIDDLVWQKNPDLSQDTLTPILKKTAQDLNLNPSIQLCVSNACASVLSAIYLSRLWFSTDTVDLVLILSADSYGPFVDRGFRSLGLLNKSGAQPFAQNRDGFYLGEAAVSILLGKNNWTQSEFEITGCGLDNDSAVMTQVSTSCESLARAIQNAGYSRDTRPDFIIAHGTGTQVNDATEDLAYTKVFSENKIPITGSKWSTGHTLGASGGVDLILACESLRNNSLFSIQSDQPTDTSLCGNYQRNQNTQLSKGPKNALVSSLGFGGVHAALKITSAGLN